MSEMTQYVTGLDHTALGLCIVATLGLLGCLALGAMRRDIVREPSPAPIERMIAALRAAVVHRQPQSL